MYRKIIIAYSESYTKHINTLCGQYAEFLNFRPMVRLVATGFYAVRDLSRLLC
jgi:hypothetical protein